MRTAFAVMDNRIAPVFDTARELLIISSETPTLKAAKRLLLGQSTYISRPLAIAECGADVLVCGAVSRPLRAMLEAYGIEVHPFVAGDVSNIVEAYYRGELDAPRFAMPGCRRGRGRGFHGGCRRGRTD